MIVEISKNALDTRRLALVFKALGDENRMAIFQLLRRRCGAGCDPGKDSADRTVTAIAKEFDLALSTVSHHLKELRTAGLIIVDKRGTQVHCRVNEELLSRVARFLDES